jgi:hypothetical protein
MLMTGEIQSPFVSGSKPTIAADATLRKGVVRSG